MVRLGEPSTRRPRPPGWWAGRGGASSTSGPGSGAFAQLLVDEGHEVFCIDRDVEVVAATTERLGTRLHVAGQVESLPYLSCHFDVGHLLAEPAQVRPRSGVVGDRPGAASPGGHLAVAYNTRDDTVPVGAPADRAAAAGRPGGDARGLRASSR